MSCKGCSWFRGDDETGDGYCAYGEHHGDIENYYPISFTSDECKYNE